jgi:predicted Zn finger-like uncharacterized protein
MIVICDKCNTKYKLDDTTITQDGVKVRCSKCGNTFIVKKPSPEDIQKIGQSQQSPQGVQPELNIHSDLDKVINETISNITANEPRTADAGTEFDWSALNENKESQPAPEEPPPPAFEWKPEPQELLETNNVQKTETGGVLKDPVPAESRQAAASLNYNEPKTSSPTVEHVIKESIKRGRPGYVSSTVLPFMKKSVISLLILIVLFAGGYFAYLYRTQLLVTGDNIYMTVAKYIAPNKQINIGVSVGESRGYFLKNIRGQQLFVIEGNVTNTTEHPVSFIKLTANIADNNNNIISSKMFFAGNILTDDELRTYTSDQINAALNNEMGQSLKNFNIPPKASIPFMVVFFDVPDNLSSFTVIPQSTHLGVR